MLTSQVDSCECLARTDAAPPTRFSVAEELDSCVPLGTHMIGANVLLPAGAWSHEPLGFDSVFLAPSPRGTAVMGTVLGVVLLGSPTLAVDALLLSN